MTDTYDQVMQIQKEERLRAKCRLINENEFIFNREGLFKDSKYIVVAALDKLSNLGGDDWENISVEAKDFIKKLLEYDSNKRLTAE